MSNRCFPLSAPYAVQSRRWFGLAILCVGVFVAILDSVIVFVAGPSIQTNLKASFGQIELIVAGYTLVSAVGLITSGRLGDGFGRRRIFLIGFTAFTAASGLCGATQSANALIMFGGVQGLSTIRPMMLTKVRSNHRSRRRRTRMRWCCCWASRCRLGDPRRGYRLRRSRRIDDYLLRQLVEKLDPAEINLEIRAAHSTNHF
jgi:sugar phosphate permease